MRDSDNEGGSLPLLINEIIKPEKASFERYRHEKGLELYSHSIGTPSHYKSPDVNLYTVDLSRFAPSMIAPIALGGSKHCRAGLSSSE